MNRRWRPTSRPALWAPQGVEPLPNPFDPLLEDEGLHRRDGAEAGDFVGLAAETIRHAVSRPLNSVSLHSVAERMVFTDAEQIAELLRLLRFEKRISELRAAELARWLCRFGTRPSHWAGGAALLEMFGSGSKCDQALVANSTSERC
ncbi:hypothetical protein [Subtercola endophyticus]|uniref:hypothetical protein n=1 Tax=Subtercola endophyticus TaxID=2895559 RepID=UPI001E56F179|nr:hypothetical protein [Subtercola endophyticus]UFS59590.1 hypothetical protein LQ955_01965 [Subtercola endophyticus]